MTRTRLARFAVAAAVCCAAPVVIAPAVSARRRVPRPPATTTTTTTLPTATTPTAPTNLRVTALTSTSVTFQWDHSQGATTGCTVPIVLYYVYVDGVFRGSTYWGSPVGHVGGLAPGGRYQLAVQGRDNCSGRTSPLSAPLLVTTLT